MIERHLLTRYRHLYGDTFHPALWAGDGAAMNMLLRDAIATRCTPLSDAYIASALRVLLTLMRPGRIDQGRIG